MREGYFRRGLFSMTRCINIGEGGVIDDIAMRRDLQMFRVSGLGDLQMFRVSGLGDLQMLSV